MEKSRGQHAAMPGWLHRGGFLCLMDFANLLPWVGNGQHNGHVQWVIPWGTQLWNCEPWALTWHRSGIWNYDVYHSRVSFTPSWSRSAPMAEGCAYCYGHEYGFDAGHGARRECCWLSSHWRYGNIRRPEILDGSNRFYGGWVFSTIAIQLSASAEIWKSMSLSFQCMDKM